MLFWSQNCIQENRPSATATHSTVRHLEGVISVSWLLILTALHWMQKNNMWHVILDVADFNCEFKRILNGCFREAEKELVFASHVCRTRLHEKVLCLFVQNWLLLWSFSSDLQNMCLTNTIFESKTTTTTWTSLRCLKRFHVVTIGLHVIFKYLFHSLTELLKKWWLWDDPFLIRFRVSIFPTAGKALKAVVHNFLVRLLGEIGFGARWGGIKVFSDDSKWWYKDILLAMWENHSGEQLFDWSNNQIYKHVWNHYLFLLIYDVQQNEKMCVWSQIRSHNILEIWKFWPLILYSEKASLTPMIAVTWITMLQLVVVDWISSLEARGDLCWLEWNNPSFWFFLGLEF